VDNGSFCAVLLTIAKRLLNRDRLGKAAYVTGVT